MVLKLAQKARGNTTDTASVMSSPLFVSLIDQLSHLGRCHILDLGPAIGANVEFFGQLHCRLHIADCIGELTELGRDNDMEQSFPERLGGILPLADCEPFDVILTWDLLNYLDKKTFAALMEWLAPVVSGDTYLHGYIASRKQIPLLPNRYRPVDGNKMQTTPSSSELRECPCYHLMDLRQLMPQFGVSRSILLQNGMQEYLFKGQGRGHR